MKLPAVASSYVGIDPATKAEEAKKNIKNNIDKVIENQYFEVKE